MNDKLLFAEWLGKTPESMFGFFQTKVSSRKPFYLEQPIEEFKTGLCLKELVNFGKVNEKEAKRSWDTEVFYGEGVGKLLIDVSPFGSFKIIIRRFIHDLQGNLTGICRYILPLVNDFNHRGPNDPTEIRIANKLHNKLEQIDREELPVCSNNKNKEFEKMVYKFNEIVKLEHPEIMFYERMQKKDENNFLISFSYRGFGNGLPNSQKAEKFLINMQYLPEQGLYHSWGYEVVSKMVTRTYLPTPSEWDEYFCPSQPAENIVKSIHNAFMTY